MLISIIVFLFLDSAKIQAAKDSQYIYELYKNEIETVREMINLDSIYYYQNDIDIKSACALLRLSRYNHETYQPIEIYTSEAKGVSYRYPEPYDKEEEIFTVLDTQTYFITDEDGMTRIPFVHLYTYTRKGICIKVEKLDPITLEKIQRYNEN